jgi:hypothetical protein
MPLDVTVIEELVQKTATIVPKNDRVWAVHYVVFSAGGWTEEAQMRAEQMITEGQPGRRKRWQPTGIRLVDLQELDADLIRWST